MGFVKSRIGWGVRDGRLSSRRREFGIRDGSERIAAPALYNSEVLDGVAAEPGQLLDWFSDREHGGDGEMLGQVEQLLRLGLATRPIDSPPVCSSLL